MREEVSTLEDFVDLDIWMRIRTKGFKYSLLNELKSWALLFKYYLKNRVIDSLQVPIYIFSKKLDFKIRKCQIYFFFQELEDFVADAVKILGTDVDKDNLNELLEVMGMLNKIEERQLETDRMFEPLKDIVQMLKEYNYEFENTIYMQVSFYF